MRIMKCGIVLILILALGLAGCHTAPIQTTAPAEPTAAPTEPTFPRPAEPSQNLTEPNPYENGEKKVSCQLLPETLDNPEDLPVLKWLCFSTCYPDDTHLYVSYSRNYQWSESAADDINAMLAESGLPFRLQFMLFTTTETGNIHWLQTPEVREAMEEADLITGPIQKEEALLYLLPITQYLSEDAEVSLSGNVAHERNWDLATYGDEVYGLPTGRIYPTSAGWLIRDEVFTQYGFTIADFQKDFFSVGEVFEKLYEKTGNQGFLNLEERSLLIRERDGATVLLPGSMNQSIENRFDCVGLCYGIDYSGEKPVVVNYLETQYVAQLRRQMFDYAHYRYSATDANQLISYVNCYSAYVAGYQQEANDGVKPGYRWFVPAEKASFAVKRGLNMTGILKESDQQALALKLLETMGEDETFRRQLLFGQEGMDYKVVDGTYQALSRQDGAYNMKFLSGMSPFCGFIYDDYGANEFHLPEAEGMTRLEAYRSSVEQSQIWAPVEFNWSEMGKEHKQIEKILREYLPLLPFVSDRTFEEKLAQIREAGGDRIKRELQRQLDEWFAENPQWKELCSLNKTEN